MRQIYRISPKERSKHERNNEVMNEYSFKRGFAQVRQKDVRKVKERIMSVLRLKTRVSWYARLNGSVEPKVSEARAIEEVFASYGIKDVWGGD